MQIFTDKGAEMSASQDVTEQVARNAVPSAISALVWLSDIPLERWLLFLTIVYTLLQIFVLVKDRIYKPRRRVREASKRRRAEDFEPDDPRN